jgi:hypothetical protein
MHRRFVIGFEQADSQGSSDRLSAALHELGAQQLLGSQWLFHHDGDAPALVDHLSQFLSPKDRLLIIEVHSWAGSNLLIDLGSA